MKTKSDVLKWLDGHTNDFTRISDAIWARPEAGHREFFASKLQADYLEANGFKIT